MSDTSSDADIDDFDIQWIFDFEIFYYFKNVYIKEFTAFCIQTNDFFTCYIKSPATILIDASPLERACFQCGTKKHGFRWNDGDMDINEFHNYLKERVPNQAVHIYTPSQQVHRYFVWDFRKHYSYTNVDLIKNISRIPKPDAHCDRHPSSARCAQERVISLAMTMRPALVPYYVPNIVYNYKKYANEMKKLELADSESINREELNLKGPLFNSLCKINLFSCKSSNESGEYSNQGNAGQEFRFGSNCDNAEASASGQNNPSDETAGAIIN